MRWQTSLFVSLLVLFGSAGRSLAQPVVIDDFADVSDWSAIASDGVEVHIAHEQGAMRIDYDFRGRGGYAIARKIVSLQLPENYQFTFRIRGNSPPNTLEFKLVDPSGDNVWWVNRRAFDFPTEWTEIVTRKRHISFAWGPAGGGDMKQVAAIEIAITAASGGKGSVWLDDFLFERREPERPYSGTPVVKRNPNSVVIDSGERREFGGLTLQWASPADYDVELSDDARNWETVYRVRNGNGGMDAIYLPERESRYVRLQMVRGRGTSLKSAVVEPLAFSETRNAFFQNIARSAPRGSYPKYFNAVQSYWTVVGVPEAEEEWLINEEGMVEFAPGAYSVEPFLRIDGRLITWADVKTEQSLEAGYLPVPTVSWDAGLDVTVWPGEIQYRVSNDSKRSRSVELYLAVRPFQVNPPWQFLGVTGGVGEIRTLSSDVLKTDADAFGATHFDGGDIVDFIRRGELPAKRHVEDPFGAASGAYRYHFEMAPGESRTVIVSAGPTSNPRTNWRALLDRVKFIGPEDLQRLVRIVRSNLAYILINADGAAIQPGSRSYDRSWIRDGSLTSYALLRLGNHEAVKRYIEWYAPFQFENGKIPCCVDTRGADPVPEHDSHGQFIWLVAEYYRFTGDRALLEAMWPRVLKTVEYIRSLRAQRMTAAYANTPFYGLVPESISHEGYSAKPMHSYWDDFFILRGLKDATYIAGIVDPPRAAELAALRDAFRADLLRSIRQVQREKNLDYIPGSVELGDFDATSTTVALTPAEELNDLPLANTFERYWQNQKNRSGEYTPYELRTVGTFVRLGQPERAHALLDFFLRDIRPRGWNHWAEVVWPDPETPKFIGDMPHTWVGSDFIRSMLDMFAYEQGEEIVIGAGLKESWINHGIAVEGLRTRFGELSYSLRRAGESVKVQIRGDVRVPIKVRGATVTSLPADLLLP